ncbi:hypothetical protein ACWZEH_17885 [Streptomyces sp. QTS137]
MTTQTAATTTTAVTTTAITKDPKGLSAPRAGAAPYRAHTRIRIGAAPHGRLRVR